MQTSNDQAFFLTLLHSKEHRYWSKQAFGSRWRMSAFMVLSRSHLGPQWAQSGRLGDKIFIRDEGSSIPSPKKHHFSPTLFKLGHFSHQIAILGARYG